MKSPTTGQETLDALGAQLATLLSGGLAPLLGPGAQQPFLGPLTRADAVVLAGTVLLVLLASGAAAAILRWRVRAAAGGGAPEWRRQLLQTVSGPLHLLIWVYGISLAVAPALLKLPPSTPPHPARQLFDGVLDLGVFVALFWFAFRLTHVIEARLATWAARSDSKWDEVLVPVMGKSLRVIVPVVAIILALPLAGLSPASSVLVSHACSLLVIGAVTWILFQVVGTGETVVLRQYDIGAADNLRARTVYTQAHVISKTLYVVIGIFAAASVLMLFEEVRRFGASILASAGVIGIIVGFAAQRTIANLFAGFQLAITQPIRIDDVVIVEGEWGRVEEITLTYVVVRIWDDRRLIVPLSHFIERPFQNWTRTSAELLGSVAVWVDYSLPLAALRSEVGRIVESCQDWDGRFWNLQVTDASDRAVQIRVLATSADASKGWDLRCEIREKLLDYIQREHPCGLPRLRAEMRDERPDGRSRYEHDAARP